MLNLPQHTLNKIKTALLRQQSHVEEELKDLEKEDPLLVESLAESSEPGTESYEADIHTRLAALKNDLMDLLKRTKNSLAGLDKGTFGVCEKCKKPIEANRLEAMPTATLCIACSQKKSRA